MADRVVETRSGVELAIGDVRPGERELLFDMFSEIVGGLQGFPHRPPLTRADFDATWGPHLSAVVVARVAGEVAGAYHVKANFPGRASHIANAGYMVAPAHRRRGIGRVLVEDSLNEAARLGFDAMQFNLVFSSNPARLLYEELGFVITGRVPMAVDDEDAYVYWRSIAP